MELQLFDTGGRFRFRLNLGEPLWTAVRGALSRISPVPDVPADDIELDRPQLEYLLRDLEHLVRKHKETVMSMHSESGYDAATVMVLGEPMRVNVRNPVHYQLKRTSDFHGSLQEVLDARLGLRLLVVPDLNSHQFRIASLLKASPRGVKTTDLKVLLQRAYDTVKRSITSDEVREELDRDAQLIDEQPVVRRSIDYLKQYGLLLEDSSHATIHPTEKLKQILV